MISVIVPVYNVEKHLHICLISILKQSYIDFEIICIDDASTDSSLEILEYFVKIDSRIKLFKNEIIMGEDFCKNRCFEIAQGDFIYFLDAEGWLNSDTFEILMEIMKKNNSDFILFNNDSKSFEEDFHNVYFMDNLDSNVFNSQNLEKYMQFLILHAPLNKFYSKSFIIENELDFDFNFFNNAFNLAKNISFLNFAFYNVFKKIGSEDVFSEEYSTLFNKFIKEFLLFIPLDDNGFIKMFDIDCLAIFKLLIDIEELYIFYLEDLIETICDAYKKYPNTIISSRTRIIEMAPDGLLNEYKNWPLTNEFVGSSFLNFITSVGGTLYFPNALSSTVFEKDIFDELCPTNDDIWFWTRAVFNKTKITGNLKSYRLKYTNISRKLGIDNYCTLESFNKYDKDDIQFKKVLEYFPEILKIIYES